MEEGGGQLLPGAVEDSETEGRDSQRRKVRVMEKIAVLSISDRISIKGIRSVVSHNFEL